MCVFVGGGGGGGGALSESCMLIHIIQVLE